MSDRISDRPAYPAAMARSPGHPALGSFGTTIFATMSALAAEHGAINLGQGFPDTDGPREMLEAAEAAIDGGRNQYPPGAGVPELLDAVAAHQERFYGLRVDPRSEVLVTAGATEAIAAVVLALCEPGDEVVTFEPYYDSYAATIALAGGVRRTSVLRFPDFAVDEASLRAAFSSRTRLVLLNTPAQPDGQGLHPRRARARRALAREHDAWVVTDEVYEHLVFDGAEHVPVATLPGMWRADHHDLLGRQDVLGHRVEGRLGDRAGRGGGRRAHRQAVPHVRRVGAVPAGRGARARPAGRGVCRPGRLAAGQARPAVAALRQAGLQVSRPAGTYFVIADAAPLGRRRTRSPSAASCRRGGVVGVPVSVFHDDVDAARTLVRFAFCKRDEVLHEASRRLAELRR